MPGTFAFETKIYTAGTEHYSLQDMLEHFVEQGPNRVSDLHLKTGYPPTFRVDGLLRRMEGPALAPDTVEGCIRLLLPEPRLRVLPEQRAVDGSYPYGGLLFRLNAFYDKDGPALAIRALAADPWPVPDIGFPNDVWHDIIARRFGLVLVTGIAGAGKSTTVAALLALIAAEQPCRIITLEDPIEYRIQGAKALVSQREVGRDVPDFARGVHDALREDPDVIFVGEMRDSDSAAWTLTAAETGHLVFSTLHTRDACGTITRILDMFPGARREETANQLALALSHIISQKLVARADGQGRVAAMEILNNSRAIANVIRNQKIEQISSFLQTRTKDISEERMTTLEHSLAQLVAQGVITSTEADRWANDRGMLTQELGSI